MILNLFIYTYVFRKKSESKLKISVLIATTIYILSIWISILTNTSSHTYIEGIGYKGWFETGNSIGAILILSMFIILNLIQNKKYRIWAIIVTILVGIYTTTMLGTRVGLLGFIGVIFLYVLSYIIITFLKHTKLNKKILISSLLVICSIVILILTIGSNTIKRRQHLKQEQIQISNNTTHISNALLELKEKIDKNELEENYMSKPAQQSLQDLYNYAEKHNIANNDMRLQQLIYNIYLVKNQHNILLILFGNGFQANFNELVMEMEIPAFICNFGICGFILYFIPVFSIFIYGMYIGIKNNHNIDIEYIMLIFGIIFAFAFSLLSGYTFFHSSSMIIVVTLNTLLINKIQKIKEEKIS